MTIKTCLIMMVRDEAQGIVKTLESAFPFVEDVNILDTGSTDGTTDLIRETCLKADKPFSIHFGTFVDFSTTRNELFERAKEDSDADFFLELSGDEVLESDPAVFKRWLEFLDEKSQRPDICDVAVRWGQSQLWHPRFRHRACQWKYEGKAHEALVSPDGAAVVIKAFGLYIAHGGPPKTQAALERDLALLETQALEKPNDMRTVFYLAQTHEMLGHIEKATDLYLLRAEGGGWWEEAYEAAYRVGVLIDLYSTEEYAPAVAISAYLDAHSKGAHRAEPFVAIAEIYRKEENWPLVFLFAQLASSMRYPVNDRLGVRVEAYQWRAHDLLAVACWNLGKYEQGLLAAGKAVSGSPRDPRLKDNLKHFEKKLGKEFAKCSMQSVQ